MRVEEVLSEPRYAPRQSDLAYASLQKLILTHDLPPGTLLRDLDLMKRLQIGRTPLREAIQRLAAEGLVTLVPRRGALVKAVTAEDYRQVREVRLENEALAARLAAARASAEDLARMDARLEESQAGAGAPDDTETFDRDMHALIANASHNPYLTNVLGMLYPLSIRWLHFVGFVRESLSVMRADHAKTVAAIRARDGEAAAAAMRAHMSGPQRWPDYHDRR